MLFRSTGGGGLIDYGPIRPVWRFPDGAKLEGKWDIDSASTFGGITAVGSTTWVFHADGTVEHASFGGVDSKTATGSSNETERSPYTFKDNKLVLGSGADARTFDIWGTNSKKEPPILIIDGKAYNEK